MYRNISRFLCNIPVSYFFFFTCIYDLNAVIYTLFLHICVALFIFHVAATEYCMWWTQRLLDRKQFSTQSPLVFPELSAAPHGLTQRMESLAQEGPVLRIFFCWYCIYVSVCTKHDIFSQLYGKFSIFKSLIRTATITIFIID